MDILTLALLFCKGDGWQRENFNITLIDLSTGTVSRNIAIIQKWTVKKLLYTPCTLLFTTGKKSLNTQVTYEIERKSIASGGYYKDNMMELLVVVANRKV